MIFQDNKTYDVLKWIALIVLPAVAALYADLGPDWGWYNPHLVAKTITEVQIFLGVVLQISSNKYANSKL